LTASNHPLDGIIVGGGPSLDNVTQEMLDRFPCITMGINQHAWARGLWTDQVVSVDPPSKCLRILTADEVAKMSWEDRNISTKLSEFNRDHPELRDTNWQTLMREPGVTKWIRRGFVDDPLVKEGESINFYSSGSNIKAKDYLTNELIYIGDQQVDDWPPDSPGWLIFHKDSFLPAFRLLYDQDVRRIWLLGVDFDIPCDARFPWLHHKMAKLATTFDDAGLQVYNCNPDSFLEVFHKCTFPTCSFSPPRMVECAS
jgi:hypothetical protein